MVNIYNKKCFIFFASLLFTCFSLSLTNELLSDESLNQSLQNFVLHTLKKRAIDSVVDLISPKFTPEKIMDLSGKAMSSLIPMVTGLTVFAIFKISVIVISSFAILATILPTLFGIAMPFKYSSLYENLNEFKKLDYTVISRSIKQLPDKSFDYFDIQGEECRARAVCEIGYLFSDKLPIIKNWMNIYGDGIPNMATTDIYAKALVKGLRLLDCGITYSDCPNSPFKRWSHITSMFKR